MSKPILCVDFDGVLHLYTSPWSGAGVVQDPPVPGAMKWLASIVNNGNMQVCIYSSRSCQEGGIEGMKSALLRWLKEESCENAQEVLKKLTFPTQKPIAHLMIDDRAICFTGTFPEEQEIRDFKPWNKRDICTHTGNVGHGAHSS
jgi:hypothetical protein